MFLFRIKCLDLTPYVSACLVYKLLSVVDKYLGRNAADTGTHAVQEHVQCRHTFSAGTNLVQAHVQCMHTCSTGKKTAFLETEYKLEHPFIDHSTLNIFCN